MMNYITAWDDSMHLTVLWSCLLTCIVDRWRWSYNTVSYKENEPDYHQTSYTSRQRIKKSKSPLCYVVVTRIINIRVRVREWKVFSFNRSNNIPATPHHTYNLGICFFWCRWLTRRRTSKQTTLWISHLRIQFTTVRYCTAFCWTD